MVEVGVGNRVTRENVSGLVVIEDLLRLDLLKTGVSTFPSVTLVSTLGFLLQFSSGLKIGFSSLSWIVLFTILPEFIVNVL